MIKTLMYILLFPLDLISLFFGICVYKISKKTPYFSYKSMHRLFYIFGGIVTEFINILTKNRITKTINYNGEDNSEILKNLNENGLFVKENFLNLYEIEEIKKILLNYEFSLRQMDGEVKKKTNEPKKYKFNPESPKAVMYSVDSNFLINQRIIQEILLKNEIYDIGRKYFGAEPIFDHVSLSISTNFNKEPDGEAAQLYHFDLDKPKWLKFLTYVNDVGIDNGPHCFIKKSHKNNAIPFNLRSKGYVRIEDHNKNINRLIQDEIKITGKAGTSIIEDTKGLHKGSVVKKGYRILLNIQINSSMFGSPYEKVNFKNIENDLLEKFKVRKNFFSQSTNLISFLNK
jgi:ectoine hydroxylase-related dioxygenase (phytanoyl-CoA dioxygenase family)